MGEGANVQVTLKDDYNGEEEGALNDGKAFEIEENRTVNMDLGTHTFELTEEGNTSAGNVNIANGTLSLQSALTLTGGVFDITEATLKNTNKANLQISAGGALNMTTGQVVEESFVGATLASGGIVNLEGSDVDATTLASKFGTGEEGSETINGIVNAAQGMTVDGIFNVDPINGKIAFENVKVWGVADDTTKSTVVTNVGSDNQVKGGWQAIELKEGDTYAQVGGTLQLVGTPKGGALITKGDGSGEAANLRIGTKDYTDLTGAPTTVILGDLEKNNQGSIGDITMSAGANNTAYLYVYGNDQTNAKFQAGDINTRSEENYSEIVKVQGATFTVDSIADNGGGAQPLDKMEVISGRVEVDGGNANLKVVTLNNGTLLATQTPATGETAASGGNITISGELSGQGLVKAADTLAIKNDLTTTDVDDLRLEGKTVNTQKLDFTGGTVTTVATVALVTDGGATLNGEDVVLAQMWALGSSDAVEASGNSLQLVTQFATSTQESNTTSNLDATYTLKDQAQLVHMDVDYGQRG